jgi:hypothetical protein
MTITGSLLLQRNTMSIFKQQAWYKMKMCNNVWRYIDKSLINIPSLIYFTWNRLLIETDFSLKQTSHCNRLLIETDFSLKQTSHCNRLLIATDLMRSLLQWEVCFNEKSVTMRSLFQWEVCYNEKSVSMRSLFQWEVCFNEKSVTMRSLFQWEVCYNVIVTDFPL